MSWLNKVSLSSESVSLLPIKMAHKHDLYEASLDGDLSSLWFTSVPKKDSVSDYIEQAMNQEAMGQALVFVVVDNKSKKIIGSTRLCNADVSNKRIEIGYTWYAKSYQRTSVNTECKLLLLTHAFEQLKCIAVVFQTHWHNQKSRTAIARLGAKQEGVIRNHKIEADGAYRDSVIFSIIENEWPSVKKSLHYKLSIYKS